MAKKYIDLRSDTVTKPSPGMREAIAGAEVGDDVFGEDPSVNRLQEMVAEILGKEAALFMASGTMSNQVAINTLTQPGDEVICERNCHLYNFECGAPALLSGVQMYPLPGEKGVITAEQIEEAIRPSGDHYPRTRLIALENTHNRAGGTIFPLAEIERIHNLARERNLNMYLDGARLWNASVATGIAPAQYARFFDAVSVCLSKGLGAPVGSVLAGSKELIARAHRYRKVYGGGMRQAGILAAAGIHALEHNRDRLMEDHQRARHLAETLSKIKGLHIDLDAVQTNIVGVDLKDSGYTLTEAIERLKSRGVLVVPFGFTKIRLVTHLDISDEDIQEAIRVFQEIFDISKKEGDIVIW